MAQGQKGHHVTPSSVLMRTMVYLVILTFLTVICARINLGPFATPVAFGIATAKAFLVMSYFMGLKYDDKSNRIIFSMGFIFLAILYFFSILDIYTRFNSASTL